MIYNKISNSPLVKEQIEKEIAAAAQPLTRFDIVVLLVKWHKRIDEDALDYINELCARGSIDF